MKPHTLVVYSGGLDSTVLLYHLLEQGHDVRALSVDYGQRHRKELEAAERVTRRIDVPHEVANLSALKPLLGGSSQTDDSVPVPEGHYEEPTMKATVVPNRNMILLAVAAARAVSSGCSAIAYAAHAGDHAVYPDCRPAFAEAMAKALLLCDYEPITLLRPFVNLTKADVVRLGVKFMVPFYLTWSCYKGEELHCGKCGTCVERREAFKLALVNDPTPYSCDVK